MAVTLVVEDGTPKTNSNTFSTVAEFKTYCDNRTFDYTTPAYSDDAISAALIRAGEWLNNEDRLPWRGLRVNDEQGMAWPRSGVIVLYGTGTALASNVIPQKIKDAQCYLAWRQLSDTDIQPDLDRGGQVASVNAGGVSVSFRQDAIPEKLYQVAHGIVKPYLRRLLWTITPTLVSDDRGYDDVQNQSVKNDGIQDRPGSDDTV